MSTLFVTFRSWRTSVRDGILSSEIVHFMPLFFPCRQRQKCAALAPSAGSVVIISKWTGRATFDVENRIRSFFEEERAILTSRPQTSQNSASDCLAFGRRRTFTRQNAVDLRFADRPVATVSNVTQRQLERPHQKE